MALELHYFGDTPIPVEVEGVTPDAVRGRSLAEIEKLPIYHGNQQLPLAEMFRVAGDPADARIDFFGQLAGVHWIGAKMTAGAVHVHGPAGRHVGSEMRGGTIDVAGDAGDWVGGELHGGRIRVRGRAGHLIGAAYRGSRRGMTGGEILIDGPCGNEIGHTMRRGLIAVGGAGDFPGVNLIAGSIFIFGPCGIRPAAGMRRGTVALLGEAAPSLLPTFRRDGIVQPVFMRVYLLALARQGYPFADDLLDAEYESYSGDLVEVGRGEILLRHVRPAA